MMRKLTVIFLSGLICLLGLTSVLAQETYELKDYEKLIGKKLTFQEAPELRIKVAAGELPPVEQRLPEEPLVVKPLEEIGQYGGTWHRVHLGSVDWMGPWYLLIEPIVRWDLNFTKIVPNVAKSWEFSNDAKSITFFLRKGMKWSDGVPFTVDDIVFWWNDIMLNDEITPVKPSRLKIGGELAKFEKIDDYTFRLHFAKPFGMILEMFANTGGPLIYAPKHYLKQFHPKYTSKDKLAKIMKKEGFTIWTDLLKTKNDFFRNPELPTIHGWYPLDSIDAPIQRYARNPYYWKVDTEGNQLPYIDRIEQTLVSDPETILLKAIAGDIDFQIRRISSLANYPVIMQYREKGNYRVITYPTSGQNYCCMFLNFSHKDPVLRKLFNNKQFRIALSIAINREEINQLLFKGLGTPAQPNPAPTSPWYIERYAKQYTEYDLNKANQILDELGLTKRDAENYRLRPDGKRLRIVISAFTPWPPENVEAMELVKGYWKKIGIEVAVKPTARELWITRMKAGDYDISTYSSKMGCFGYPPTVRAETFPFAQTSWWAPQWGLWFATNGKSGEEPPADVKKIMEIYEEILSETSVEKRNALIRKVIEIHGENFWTIGIIMEPTLGRFSVVKNNFRNVSRRAIDWETLAFCSAQYFIKK